MKDDIKGKKIMVTGGAGFIGSHLVDRLIDLGARVVIVDNLSTGLKQNINPKAVFYKLDINDKKIKNVFEKEKPQVVFLLACNTKVPKSIEDPMFDIQSLVGNLNVLVNAKNNKVSKIIAASSGFVYGNTTKFPTPESAPIIPENPYIINKSAMEKYVEFFCMTYNIEYVILRYATVYGPRQVGGAMADYIRNIKAGTSADIYGNGKKTRDYVYIEDVIQANMLALKYKPHKNVTPIFNIGTGVETTLNSLYSKICKILNKKSKPTYQKDRKGEMFRFSLSTSKSNKYLHWKYLNSLDEGLKKILLNK
ncbi:UDP-glucose 4-epimerase [bioreactor metagenome]|uniref:UDP-glucose 4-epimerase n=1 Tax=bioreactor metagenome TaxID=1076179 RepID=A0A644T5X8_9ZZZZ|nr:NAD-dependent epimerase/dehydratase family protein [Candidatus Elulimicrobiales bacterium]